MRTSLSIAPCSPGHRRFRPLRGDGGALMPGKVFSISAGEFIHGVPHTWTFVETQTRSLTDLGWAVTLSVVDDRTSIRGIARNVRRLRAEVARSGAEVVHAQYGSVTAAVADAARGALPLVISFCGERSPRHARARPALAHAQPGVPLDRAVGGVASSVLGGQEPQSPLGPAGAAPQPRRDHPQRRRRQGLRSSESRGRPLQAWLE